MFCECFECAVLCNIYVQCFVSLVTQARHEPTWHWVQALRLACERLRLTEVAEGLAALNAHAQQDLHSLLGMLCPPLCTAFFPRYRCHCYCLQPATFVLASLQVHWQLDSTAGLSMDLTGTCTVHIVHDYLARCLSTMSIQQQNSRSEVQIHDCLGVPKLLSRG